MVGFCCCGAGNPVYSYCGWCLNDASPAQFLVEVSGFNFTDVGYNQYTCSGTSNCNKINGNFIADRVSECLYEYVFPVTGVNNACHPRRVLVEIADYNYYVRLVWSWTSFLGGPIHHFWTWRALGTPEFINGKWVIRCLEVNQLSLDNAGGSGDLGFPCLDLRPPAEINWSVVLSAL